MKTDLFDGVTVKFESLKQIMQTIFKERFPQKIHLLKDISRSLKASSLLNLIVVDWLVNHGTEEAKVKRRPIVSKSVPRVQPTSMSVHKATKKQGLGDFFNPDKAAIIGVIRDRKLEDNTQTLKAAVEKLSNEKLYLLRAQEQTDVKIDRFKIANADLVKEYNQLYERGRKLYDLFFEMFYSMKLNPKAKLAKMEFGEEELSKLREFKNFQRLALSDKTTADENPMLRIIRSKSSNQIYHSDLQTTSKIGKSTSRLKENSNLDN